MKLDFEISKGRGLFVHELPNNSMFEYDGSYYFKVNRNVIFSECGVIFTDASFEQARAIQAPSGSTVSITV